MFTRVNLEYLKELHNLRNDYSLAPEKIEIKKICYLIIVRRSWTRAMFLIARLKTLLLIYLIKNDMSSITKLCSYI